MAKLNSTACTLLGFLHDRPMTGWDLAESVQLTIGQFWNMSRSQVYRELKTLEEGGFVVGGDRGARDKRHYTITEDGRAAFKDWISQEPGPEIARYPMLITVWFGDHLDDVDLGWSLSVHYARHRKRLEFLNRLYEEVEDESLPASRATRFGRMYEQMVVDWFETLPWFGGAEETLDQAEEPRPSIPRKPSDYTGARVRAPVITSHSDQPGDRPRKAAAKKGGAKKAAKKGRAKKAAKKGGAKKAARKAKKKGRAKR